MKRLIHRLFRRHHFLRYELLFEDRGTWRLWYVGYVCDCGEPGFEVPS